MSRLQVTIELGRSLLPDGWHLERLKVVCLEPAATYLFTCNAWLDKKNGTKKEWTLEGHLANSSMGLTLEESPGTAMALNQEQDSNNPGLGQASSDARSAGMCGGERRGSRR